MKSLSFWLDIIFVLISSFLLTFFIGNYFIPYPYSLVHAGVWAALFSLISFKHFSKKRNKRLGLSAAEKEYAEVITLINFMEKDELISLLTESAIKLGYDIEERKSHLFVPQKNLYLFTFLGYDSPQKKDIVKAYNLIAEGEKAVILSEAFSEDVILFASRFGEKIKLVDGRDLFKGLKETGCLPQGETPFHREADSGNKLKRAAKNLINKKHAKNYLLFGVAFLFLSYFVPIKLYYVICGSVMLILSLITRLFGNTEESA